jgi:hypothetical protein
MGLWTFADCSRRSPLCEYCRAPVSFAVSLDHADPIARGGTLALDNLAVSCERCNSLKGMLTEAEFRELLTFLALLHPLARTDLERRLLAGSARYAGKRSQTKAARFCRLVERMPWTRANAFPDTMSKSPETPPMTGHANDAVTVAFAYFVHLTPPQRKQFLRKLRDFGIIGRRPRGERKLHRNDVICTSRAEGKSITSIARNEGMTYGAVRMVLYRRRHAPRTYRLPAA